MPSELHKVIPPYKPKGKEEYMNARQLAYFRHMLEEMKRDLSQDIDEAYIIGFPAVSETFVLRELDAVAPRHELDVAAVHLDRRPDHLEGFPYAVEISKRGYNAFVLKYRAGEGGRIATEDLAAALTYIFRNASGLGVTTADYSLWGSSAGARMAAAIGSHGAARFGGATLPRPAARARPVLRAARPVLVPRARTARDSGKMSTWSVAAVMRGCAVPSNFL